MLPSGNLAHEVPERSRYDHKCCGNHGQRQPGTGRKWFRTRTRSSAAYLLLRRPCVGEPRPHWSRFAEVVGGKSYVHLFLHWTNSLCQVLFWASGMQQEAKQRKNPSCGELSHPRDQELIHHYMAVKDRMGGGGGPGSLESRRRNRKAAPVAGAECGRGRRRSWGFQRGPQEGWPWL